MFDMTDDSPTTFSLIGADFNTSAMRIEWRNRGPAIVKNPARSSSCNLVEATKRCCDLLDDGLNIEGSSGWGRGGC